MTRCQHVHPSYGRCILGEGHTPLETSPRAMLDDPGAPVSEHAYPPAPPLSAQQAEDLAEEVRSSAVDLIAAAQTFAVGAFVETSLGIRQPVDDPRPWAEEYLSSLLEAAQLDAISILGEVETYSDDERPDALVAAAMDVNTHGVGYLRLDRYRRLTRVDPETIRLTGPRATS